MILLALDPSSTNVGYCIAEDERYILSGVFSPQGKPDARVWEISRWARHKISTYEVQHVILEEPAVTHGNARVDRLLARVGGVIEAHALSYGAQVSRVHPAQVKASGCSKDALHVAAAIANKGAVGPDEADAIGVWLAGLRILRFPAEVRY